MRKIDVLYKKLLQMRVVSIPDIVSFATTISGTQISSKYTYNKYLRPLIQDGKLLRIKQGLYFVLDPLETIDHFSMDPFLVASNIRRQYYLGFHTALEFYGCAHSPFNTTYICVHKKDKFNEFTFQNRLFKPVYTTENELGIEKQNYISHDVLVSSKERTFLDCIDRVEYAGGWEECLKSLESMSGLDFEKLLCIVNSLDCDILRRKVGFLLQMFHDTSLYYQSVDGTLLELLKKRIGHAPCYLEKGQPSHLNQEWNLYIPKRFPEYLRGIV
jgi:predicted transcriptional regulator of viral defense system